MFWTIVIIVIVIAILIGVGQAAVNAEAVKSQATALSVLSDFTPAVSYQAGSLGPGLALDAERSKFAIIPAAGDPRVFAFDQLVAVDVERNGQSIQVTNRGSQALGAAVGGLLLGPIGLLAGSVTGSKRTSEKVCRLALKIYTNDLVTPVTEVVFFNQPNGVSPGSIQLKPAADNLDQWYGRFRTILAGHRRQPSAHSIENVEQKRFRVLLHSAGGRKIEAIVIVKEVAGLGLGEAKNLVESLPAVIASSLPLGEANAVVARFNAIGASTSLEEVLS